MEGILDNIFGQLRVVLLLLGNSVILPGCLSSSRGVGLYGVRRSAGGRYVHNVSSNVREGGRSYACLMVLQSWFKGARGSQRSSTKYLAFSSTSCPMQRTACNSRFADARLRSPPASVWIGAPGAEVGVCVYNAEVHSYPCVASRRTSLDSHPGVNIGVRPMLRITPSTLTLGVCGALDLNTLILDRFRPGHSHNIKIRRPGRPFRQGRSEL